MVSVFTHLPPTPLPALYLSWETFVIRKFLALIGFLTNDRFDMPIISYQNIPTS